MTRAQILVPSLRSLVVSAVVVAVARRRRRFDDAAAVLHVFVASKTPSSCFNLHDSLSSPLEN